MTAPKITIARKTGADAAIKRMYGITKLAAYVGIPSSATEREAVLREMAGRTTSKKKRARINAAIESDVTNAELLYIHTKGSPLKNIPARSVLEPAVEADGNRQAIANELAQSAKASLHGDRANALRYIKRAGLAGQNAARKWFTDARNHWAPNKPATICRKGSSKPLIDTGALRAAITYVIKED